jgi:hypothetical protein
MRIPDNPIEKFLFFAVFSVFGYSCAKATLRLFQDLNSSNFEMTSWKSSSNPNRVVPFGRLIFLGLPKTQRFAKLYGRDIIWSVHCVIIAELPQVFNIPGTT